MSARDPVDGGADADAFLAAVKLDDRGLVPVIAQDQETGVVRMFAWANAQALRATQTTGDATFWSRSRQRLWRKGEESGNTLPVRELRLDCDGDVVLYLVAPTGPSCHTGQVSCFFRRAEPARQDPATPTSLVEDDGPPEVAAAIVSRLARVIAGRRAESPDKSYVASLLAKGFPKIEAKINEEARELNEALPGGDAKHIAHEAADLLFHVLVGLEAARVPVDAVFAELRRRFGVGGHVEKASRNK